MSTGRSSDAEERPAPTLPPVERIAEGAWSLPLPIPVNPLAYVLAYALETGDGVVLVDSGWNTPETFEALERGLARLGAEIGSVRGVLVTHIHPDHYGLAGRIREESGAWVALHPADAALVHSRYEDVDELLDRIEAWLRAAGAPESAVDDLRDASLAIRHLVVTAQPDVLLEDGDRPDVAGWDLVAVHTPGHTPGHLVFRADAAGLVFTGDHVLPRITPHVGVNPQSTDDPLGDFLDSLDRLRGLGEVLALPGHEYRFDDLDSRLDALRAHHEERLDDVLRIVEEGAETVWDVASRYRWSRGWDRLEGFMRRAALGEVQAHLRQLETRGRLERVEATPLRWRLPAGRP
ncbi:MAG: MBL fold metallo-hydrolase [Nitriliruptorales bacterium]